MDGNEHVVLLSAPRPDPFAAALVAALVAAVGCVESEVVRDADEGLAARELCAGVAHSGDAEPLSVGVRCGVSQGVEKKKTPKGVAKDGDRQNEEGED